MKRILIVDDDGDTRDILKMLFNEDGFGVVTAENGKAAIEILEQDNAKDLIRHVVRRMIEMKGSESRPRQRVSRPFVEPVYRSPAMKSIMATVRKISNGNAPVLILGRSGTGKEMVA